MKVKQNIQHKYELFVIIFIVCTQETVTITKKWTTAATKYQLFKPNPILLPSLKPYIWATGLLRTIIIKLFYCKAQSAEKSGQVQYAEDIQ